MTDTPTREQVQEALKCGHVVCPHEVDHGGVIDRCVRAWLEGPQVDEARIERAARCLHEGAKEPWDEEFPCGICLSEAEYALKAALEVTE